MAPSGCAGRAGAAGAAGAGAAGGAAGLTVSFSAWAAGAGAAARGAITAAAAPPGFAAGAFTSAAARIAAGRSTIVFSKSALSAAAAGAASPTNLSLYLPSSTTSLFCRKCFLTGLPLISVPLVLPRSSRKESFRIVTMTACSPLTARLSIWMSLCGLRPMVVRSLERGISLSTRPSILSISFAIADPWGLFEPPENLAHHSSRRRVFPQDAYEYNRYVVLAAVVIGHLHQLLRGELEVGAEGRQRHADVLVIHHVAQSVRAQQVDIADARVVLLHFRLHRRIDAERLGDEVLVRRVLGLLGGDDAAVDLLLQQRVIARDLGKLAVAHAVQARVAEVRDQDLVVVEQAHHQRGAHAGVLRLALRRLVDGGVGLDHLLADHARRERRLGVRIELEGLHLAEQLLHFGRHDGGRHAARHLAGVVAAHAVGEHDQPIGRVRRDGIFVVRADHARIRAARDLENLAVVHSLLSDDLVFLCCCGWLRRKNIYGRDRTVSP